MKNFVIILICFLTPLCFVFGQEVETELDEFVVTPPKFTGMVQPYYQNQQNIYKYMAANLDFNSIKESCEPGTTVVSFSVLPSGKLSGFEVVNSVNPIIDDEVIRVLKTSEGMWIPGLNNGKNVAMEREISVAICPGSSSPEEVRKQFTRIAEYNYKRGAKKLYEKENARAALRNFDQCVRLFPRDQSAYLMRGCCKYKLNDMEGAIEDWQKVKDYGGVDMLSAHFEKMKQLDGFSEMEMIMAKLD